jgi:hypothetical protein
MQKEILFFIQNIRFCVPWDCHPCQVQQLLPHALPLLTTPVAYLLFVTFKLWKIGQIWYEVEVWLLNVCKVLWLLQWMDVVCVCVCVCMNKGTCTYSWPSVYHHWILEFSVCVTVVCWNFSLHLTKNSGVDICSDFIP